MLIIIDSNEQDLPSPSLFNRMNVDKIWLLHLFPRFKAWQYKEKLSSVLKQEVKIEILNPKNLVDFEHLKKNLLDFIASVPSLLKISDSSLSEYLTIHGLNMWWTSGVVEATPYKQDLLQNLYYLSAIYHAIQELKMTAVWFQVKNKSLEKDLIQMLDNAKIKYYQGSKSHQRTGIISYAKRWKLLRLTVFLTMHLTSSILFKLLSPKWLNTQNSKTIPKFIHLFYTFYPFTINIKDSLPEIKIYGCLPSVLSKNLGGEAYYLCYISPKSILHPMRLIKDMRNFWEKNIRLIPMEIFISLWDIIHVFLSPTRYFKYFNLRKDINYRKAFKIEGIDLFHTFDECIKNSLLGDDAWENLLHYHAFRKFALNYGEKTFHIFYYLEFHSWEVALLLGVKDADKSIPLIGLQQSAPNPTLLSFFFSPIMFKNKSDRYPLPDLILCSGKLYRELLLSYGINSDQVEVIGHIIGQYLNQLPYSNELKRKKRNEINLPNNRKICLVPCSIDMSLTEGIMYLLEDVVDKLPEVLFLIKGHPDSPIKVLLDKYNLNSKENVKATEHNIATLLPLSDYFISTSTSVSQEALWLGLPQVNLDIGGLPQANPLHLVSNLIVDVETQGDLIKFFLNTEKYGIPKNKRALFIEETKIDPCHKILNIVISKFHK
ncbi:MAG: hypothetical protein HQ555_13000 [Candidatus Aminicenantes bacterium]|nr:hypothetical protein [Candidatus Aminicenantes bacterium]